MLMYKHCVVHLIDDLWLLASRQHWVFMVTAVQDSFEVQEDSHSHEVSHQLMRFTLPM